MNTRLFHTFVLAFCSIFIGCSSGNENLELNPSAYLSQEEQSEFMYSISRYICHLPKKATYDNRFDAKYDSVYRAEVSRHSLVFYYHEPKTGIMYFATKRIAPSLKVKYVLTAGKFKPGEGDPLNDYEEVFRTWKMEEPELIEKSQLLFTKMVNGEDLTPFYSENSNGVEYIEFPDKEVSYNKEHRKWVTTRDDILKPYRELYESIPDSTDYPV
jgi:hypothetical protein